MGFSHKLSGELAKRWVKLAVGGGSAYWLGPDGEVYRAPEGAELDTTQAPMGKRWECSIAHWNRYRAIYSWVVDVEVGR